MKNLSKGLNGVEFMRACVRFLDARNEHLNENKTPKQLVKDYKRYLKKL